ncbi:hypothetical protein COU20_00050 [Candidatus Kaiserbacteria bacterium CG10_big_fil_rev_8_21_14_0_10_59_10]|uniref:Uncharacterized protein n=1 Tax=Candidatus Kaiserbacteria bacterium CG10_big_fil_rev_8_21_14_0_10_59_10 TaxID=1974612 RepID=A0A2H0U923_9BACT|nr:MAG: hypothetical protein COU20_00050 [Candidatus Kaiserbacteria bacterium CG10_big_fil_rev_8_21_14_0_10_59_10]
MRASVTILSVLLLILAAATAVFLLRPDTAAAPTASAVAPTGVVHEVTLGEDGFSPRELTVALGDEVVFRTTRNEPFWPASNVHPTHTLYPAFDPQEPVAPEDSWSFVFDKPGEWRYHDHILPYYTGTITVIE